MISTKYESKTSFHEEEQDLYEHYRFHAVKGQKLQRVDKYLVNKLSDISRNRIQTATSEGNVLVNQKPVKPSYKVKPGDLITIVLPFPPRELVLIPEPIPLNIFYEDEHLLVVNKQAGLVVHPGVGNSSGTLVNALLYHLGYRTEIKNEHSFPTTEKVGNDHILIRPGLVHRLDKNTTGLMVVAKNEVALTKIAKQFFDRTIERTYVALVWGDLKNNSGTIKGNIGRSKGDRKIMAVFPDDSEGKHAVTHYKVIERFGYVTLVECRLETGRTHQIRVHFKHYGYPLFADAEYGGKRIVKGLNKPDYRKFVFGCFDILNRQALHAKTLGFIHPATNQKLSFTADMPEDMEAVINRCKAY